MAKTKKALLATLTTFVALILCVFFALTTAHTAYALTGSIAQNDDVYYPVNLVQTQGGTITCDATTAKITRFAGENRYETASVINDAVADANTYAGVIVASGENGKFADALAASGLSGMLNFPVVLVNGSANSLDSIAVDTIDNLLGYRTGDIYVLGGENTVSKGVIGDLYAFDTNGDIPRLSGDDRYETARITYNYEIDSGLWDNTYITVVKGNDFPDALGAAPFCATYGVPVLLTDQNTDVLEGYITGAAKNAENALIVGGDTSVTSAKEAAISRYVTTTRIAGSDRYETSANLTAWECEVGMDATTLGVATGASFPDALGSSGLLSIYDAPILLTNDSSTANLCSYVKASQTKQAFIFGGTASVSTNTETALRQALCDQSSQATYPGSEVCITATPDTGYTLAGITVTTASGKAVSVNADYTFVMPTEPVIVSATWQEIPEPGEFIVTLEQTTGGTIYADGCIVTEDGTLTANATDYIEDGDIITITPVAEEGWTLKALRYKGCCYNASTGICATRHSSLELISANDDGSYTFVMPPSDVRVIAEWIYGDGEDGGNHTWEWIENGGGFVCNGCGELFLTGAELTAHCKPYMLDPNNTHDMTDHNCTRGCWRCTTCGMYRETI